MSGKTLDRKQAERHRDAIRPGLTYLHELRRRLEQAGFTGNDLLFQLVRRAEDDVQALFVELHYQSCESGVGRQDGASS